MAAAVAEVSVLPDSVLLQVLALLPPWDRLRPSRVCRRWRRLALDPTVWRHVDVSQRRLSSRALWQLLRRRLPSGLCTLRARGSLLSSSRPPLLSPALLLALGKRCPRLQHLSLTETDLRRIPYESIPASLRALELRRCEIPAAWFHPGSSPRPLRHLHIHHVPAFSDQHLLAACSQHRLQTLSLRGSYRLTEPGMQRAAPYLQGLRRLELRGCGAGDATMASIGYHMKGLRELEVVACPVSSAGLGALKGLQHLEVLCLELGEKVSAGAVIALGRALPLLRELRVVGACLALGIMDQIRMDLSHCSCTHSPQPPA
ncbi:F-box/LRR-repeat protein 12 [Neopsephotus bourkii]|uniref:F-box/LRR-repeat protein 12 n=1 Tax=Neopsephotus bourkii TaxID=309878 RepID=UPI002AA54F71|nr:F-box/LRR-repeat protein 12 [Neopsephotus bourkii]